LTFISQSEVLLYGSFAWSEPT